MSWHDWVRYANLIIGVMMLAISYRVVREQMRRGWGDGYQYIRFFALGGWCFLSGSVIVSLEDYPITWRTYGATVLQISSLIGTYGIRRQQQALPPGEDHEHRSGIGRISTNDPTLGPSDRWSPSSVRRRRRPPGRGPQHL